MTIDYSIKVTQCEPMPGYKLKVTCSDGATGIFDMSRYVDRGMFKPLKDPQTFDRVRLAFGSSRSPRASAPTVIKTAGAFSCPYA
ncbi:MAG: DUF2442 domain-containing protein [Bifidobacterium breve]|nr:DUF2442 domain-containing protein [Bifidobacterium breve]